MTLGQHQQVFMRHLVELLLFAFKQGYEVRGGELQRPLEMQQLYVKTGRSKTMNSNHIKKCAADLFIFKDGRLCQGEELHILGKFWESLDPLNKWGGFWGFKDEPHFERRA